jgi:hypothetical protein
MQDYTEYLKSLAATQKQTKAQELEMAKQQALTTVEQEKARVMPTFQAQRQQASTQSQLGAKNFAEYLASRGQTGAGISAQAEMSRQNALAGQIGTIGTNEANTLQQYANQVGNIGQQYQTGLQSAYGDIDTDLAKNLYNEKIRVEQETYNRKQQEFENQMTIKNYNRLVSSGGSGGGSKSKNKQEYAEGSVKLVQNVPYTYIQDKNGKWGWQKKTYTKDEYGNIAEQKQLKWNKKGYGMTPYTIETSNGKRSYTYSIWTKNDKSYLIKGENTIELSIDGINKAVQKGIFDKTSANNLIKNLE